MLLDDALYGRVIVNEPVLLDIIRSDALARLKAVHQGGGSFLVRRGRDGTRFEHSVGVALLIRRLGGSTTEQAAGLVHDVAHTAFSHVIDYAFERLSEDYHERHAHLVVERSELPHIANRYGIDIAELLDADRWPLLEQPSPHLCADRIDYALRDLLRIGWITRDEVTNFLASLIVDERRIVVGDADQAEWFARQFARVAVQIFLDPRETYANRELATAIQFALRAGELTESDLLETDDVVLERLRSSRSKEVRSRLAKLTPSLSVKSDIERFEYEIRTKPRYVDPLVRTNKGVVPITTLRPSVVAVIEDARDRASRGIRVRAA
jgi:HD superfamily phosphohydrolase